MNQESLREQINQRFGDDVTINKFIRKDDRLPLLNDDDYSWRDYLLETFGLRLKIAEKKHVDLDILSETKSFINELQKLPEDAILYIWQASSDANRYLGWASEEKLIYAIKLNQEPSNHFLQPTRFPRG